MKIQNKDQITFSVNRYQNNDKLIQKSLTRLSTGKKIPTSSDNASGLSISETMRAQIRGISRAQSNMQDGLSLLESANEGLNNVNELMHRARELAVSGANDTMTTSDRENIQEEINQVLDAINDTANTLEFNTRNILGENTTLNLHVGANPGQKMTIQLIDISADSLGIADISVLSNAAANETISTLDNAINQVSAHLTAIGSNIQAIESHLRNALTFENNLTQSLSLLEDVDIAEEMMNYISLDIRQHGDNLLIQQVNQRTQGILNIF